MGAGRERRSWGRGFHDGAANPIGVQRFLKDAGCKGGSIVIQEFFNLIDRANLELGDLIKW